MCAYQVAETKAKSMDDEVCRLRERLQERDGQIEATHSAAEQVITCSPLLVAFSHCEVGICLYLSLKKKKPSGTPVTSPGCVCVCACFLLLVFFHMLTTGFSFCVI